MASPRFTNSVMIEVIAAKERSMTERFLRGKYETNESIEADQWYRDVYVSEWTYLYWLLFTGLYRLVYK